MTTEQKVALVTGATRGIGQAIALTLAKKGHYVIGTATTESGREAIHTLFVERGLPGEALILDVTNQQQIDLLMTRLADEHKLPAVLVNNAGITRDNLLLR